MKKESFIMILFNEFLAVNVYSKKELQSFISNLSEIKIPYYVHKYLKDEGMPKGSYMVYIRYRVNDTIPLIDKDVLSKRFPNHDLMNINMYQKYYIAFAKLENDNISDVTMISDATLVYDKDGIIFESELFEEALKAYDIVKKVYTGSDEVFFFTEILDEDILGDDIFICNDIIDRFRVM